MMPRGGQLSVKPDPPDKSGWPDHPPANSYSDEYRFHLYIFSGFWRGMDYPFFVRYPPDPPNTYIKIKSNPTLISFFSHIFSAASLTPSLLRSHASITPMPPSLPRLHHGATPSQRRFVNLSPHGSLPHSVASSISHLTAHSNRSLLPSWPHPVKSLASLTASLAQIHASTQIWFVILILFLG